MKSNHTSLARNFLYNTLYQLINLILPFFSAPYLYRVLGVDNIGSYSYIHSISQLFVIFTMLGLNNYGNRTVARNRDDKTKLSKVFWEIYFMQVICAIVVGTFYCIFVLNLIDSSYRVYAAIQVLVIIAASLDISWFFFGIEAFKLTTLRSSIIRLVAFVLTFVVIRNESDLWKYFVLTGVQTVVVSVTLWPFLKSNVVWYKPQLKNVMGHMKGNVLLFIPLLAISMYKYMDKVMLGAISGEYQTGLYESADKILNIVQSCFTALGTVMLPRMSSLAKDGDTKVIDHYMGLSMIFVFAFSSASLFGLLGISERFVPLYFGTKYNEASFLLMGLTPVLLVSPWKMVIRTHYLIPLDKNKSYIISVFAGALINLIVNLVCIPDMGAKGAVIGTVVAEVIVCIFQTAVIIKDINIVRFMKNGWIFYLSGLVMYLFIKTFERVFPNSVISILAEVVLGAVVWVCVTFVLLIVVKPDVLALLKSQKTKKNRK